MAKESAHFIGKTVIFIGSKADSVDTLCGCLGGPMPQGRESQEQRSGCTEGEVEAFPSALSTTCKCDNRDGTDLVLH